VLGKRILTVPAQGEFDVEDEGRNELLKRDKYLKLRMFLNIFGKDGNRSI
jgi:hypothetical protein